MDLKEMNEPKKTGYPREVVLWYLLLLFWFMPLLVNFVEMNRVETIPYSEFMTNAHAGNLDDLTIAAHEISGKLMHGKGRRFKTVRVEDPQLAERLGNLKVKFRGEPENDFLKSVFSWLAPALLFFGVWIFMASRFGGKDGIGPGLMSIEKSRARVYKEDKVKVSFSDVADALEAKEELQEIIGFLKEPQRYSRLGGHLPKGVLLVGAPGTGKTLLARAVAGEAGVPFFSISGSEFVEMFVGVGAARVRDLFSEAQHSAPCIIFIDELDALGRARGLNPLGSHDEKEQTLNQLLVEMDGFDSKHGVVLLAATNRPEILDPALLRAGRFDRHIMVERPDRAGRAQILHVHLRNVTKGNDVDVESIAAATPGFTGADLANLVNEAVLLATRRQADAVQSQDFNAALERLVAGLEKKNRLLNMTERKVVAFHEMGHALVSMSIPDTDPVHKVSIIPRGIGALGYTLQRPTEDRYLMSRRELENKLTILLGGRAAETVVFDDISTGAADDLSKATDIARSMATRYGMIAGLAPVAYETDAVPLLSGAVGERRRFSEETEREIDCAVRAFIANALDRAISILQTRRSILERGAALLLEKETLGQDDLRVLCTNQADAVAAQSMVAERAGIR